MQHDRGAGLGDQGGDVLIGLARITSDNARRVFGAGVATALA